MSIQEQQRLDKVHRLFKFSRSLFENRETEARRQMYENIKHITPEKHPLYQQDSSFRSRLKVGI